MYRITPALAALALSACQLGSLPPGSQDPNVDGGGGGGGDDDAEVTFYRDVLPIVNAKCAACHTDGGASFALDTIDGARAMAGPMAASTAAGTMPPWPVDNSCADYEGAADRSLTPSEIAVFADWNELGAPAGRVDDAPPPRTDPPNTLGAPDYEVDPGGDYNFSNAEDDLYWCFRMRPNTTSALDIVAMDIEPGNREVVHHVIVYREANSSGEATGLPGFECGGIPSGGEFMFGWVPGAQPTQFPPGIAMQLAPTDTLVMQVHYHSTPGAPPTTDRTKVRLYTAKQPVAEYARVVWTGSIDIDVPAGGSGDASGSCDVPSGGSPVKLFMAAPHMHEIGATFKTVIERNGGGEECVLDIPQWDFEWQGGYKLNQPIMVQPGETIRTTCTFSNNTGTDVGFGEGTGDEMCFGYMFVVDNGQLPQLCFSPCNFLPCEQFL